ncbi:MAG TPA: PP2C family protein-serine/threonine phosphatase [Nocardioidaceae bacterium]|nr:PP2C family protein-serine/threonine phosphatase [Nocardioidaceae bacterium]
MVTPRQPGKPGSSAARVLRRRYERVGRRLQGSETLPALLLCLTGVAIGIAQTQSINVPLAALIVPMVIGNQVLGPRTLPWVVVFLLGVLVAVVSSPFAVLDGRRIGGVVVIFAVGLIILVSSFRRTSLGVAGARGETMLVDLRDRINRQAGMPALPEPWYAESEMRSAGGSAFAGDFVVGSLSADGRRLQVAVVDVSGKGEQAGSRSLLLSGAFGGLLGALPPAEFLPAANDYLLRQDWPEGFATAVHLAVDLDSGRFELRSAGHPPGVQLAAAAGRWTVHEAEGPVLGLMQDARFSSVSGVLRSGDALLLFTDGLVETADRDLSLGIDKLLGQAEQLLRRGFDGGARRLIDRVESVADDRALLLLHRR